MFAKGMMSFTRRKKRKNVKKEEEERLKKGPNHPIECIPDICNISAYPGGPPLTLCNIVFLWADTPFFPPPLCVFCRNISGVTIYAFSVLNLLIRNVSGV